MKTILNNWKTTLAGLIPLLVSIATPYFVPGVATDWHSLYFTLGLAAVGFLAKDAEKPQPPIITTVDDIKNASKVSQQSTTPL